MDYNVDMSIPLTPQEMVIIKSLIQELFKTYGDNGKADSIISQALKDEPLQFAMGVDVSSVITFVFDAIKCIRTGNHTFNDVQVIKAALISSKPGAENLN